VERIEIDREILSITRAIAQFYGAIEGAFRETGLSIPSSDICIAALAREPSLAILSRDSHFDAVPRVIRFSR